MLINTTKLSKRACFLKIKKIIDKKLKINGNIIKIYQIQASKEFEKLLNSQLIKNSN